ATWRRTSAARRTRRSPARPRTASRRATSRPTSRQAVRPRREVPMTDAVLEVRDLVKHYPVRQGLLRRSVAAVKAVDGVSLTLERGRTLGLVGESGSGKSTLARVLVGIEAPTSGQVLVDGEDVSRLSRAGRKQLRRDVQMVFQDPYTSLNPRMSVGEIVGEPFAIHGIDPAGGPRAAAGRPPEPGGLDLDPDSRHP